MDNTGKHRENGKSVAPQTSNQGEQRQLPGDSGKTIEQFKKIPMFRGLREKQLAEILKTCSRQKYAAQKPIYTIGEQSETMFVLLKGEISIMFSSGLEVKSIRPAGTVGEMGLFTGEPRSATVIALTDCHVLMFNRTALLTLFNKDKDLAIKILLNVVKELSKKMRQDNDKLEELLYRIRSIDLV